MSYDPKCWDLAVEFLEDCDISGDNVSEERENFKNAKERVAQAIQDAIEDELDTLVTLGLIKERP